MKITIIHFMICFLCCCSSNNTTRRAIYDSIFQNEEIIQLRNIEQNFYKLVSANYPSEDTITSLQKLFDCIEDDQLKESNYHHYISCLNESEFINLYHDIKKLEIYNQIWTPSSYYDPKTKEILGYDLDYNESGKYFKYLEFLYNENPEKYPYYKSIVLVGGGMIPPTFYTGLDKYVITYFNEPDYKLVGAIHYLTIIFNELADENLLDFND